MCVCEFMCEFMCEATYDRALGVPELVYHGSRGVCVCEREREAMYNST